MSKNDRNLEEEKESEDNLLWTHQRLKESNQNGLFKNRTYQHKFINSIKDEYAFMVDDQKVRVDSLVDKVMIFGGWQPYENLRDI